MFLYRHASQETFIPQGDAQEAVRQAGKHIRPSQAAKVKHSIPDVFMSGFAMTDVMDEIDSLHGKTAFI